MIRIDSVEINNNVTQRIGGYLVFVTVGLSTVLMESKQHKIHFTTKNFTFSLPKSELAGMRDER